MPLDKKRLRKFAAIYPQQGYPWIAGFGVLFGFNASSVVKQGLQSLYGFSQYLGWALTAKSTFALQDFRVFPHPAPDWPQIFDAITLFDNNAQVRAALFLWKCSIAFLNIYYQTSDGYGVRNSWVTVEMNSALEQVYRGL